MKHRITLILLALLITPTSAQEADFTNTSPKDLGLTFVTAKKDAKTGFMVGGKNATALIRKLTEINGRTIAELEKDMRPGAAAEVGSRLGFLGKEEKLLDILAEDNDFIVGKLGLTHQQLARHLHVAGAIAVKHAKVADAEGFTFHYHGRRYHVSWAASRGIQLSPFYDDTKTNVNVTVSNLTNNTKLTYSLLVPHMVERYGFYEGHGTPYRVEPRRVLAVFDFLTPLTRPPSPPGGEGKG